VSGRPPVIRVVPVDVLAASEPVRISLAADGTLHVLLRAGTPISPRVAEFITSAIRLQWDQSDRFESPRRTPQPWPVQTARSASRPADSGRAELSRTRRHASTLVRRSGRRVAQAAGSLANSDLLRTIRGKVTTRLRPQFGLDAVTATLQRRRQHPDRQLTC
jgi:hypothetical protein